MKFFWLIAMFGAICGGITLVGTFLGANGAPQEAAGAAIACALCVIPYVLARSLEGMSKKD